MLPNANLYGKAEEVALWNCIHSVIQYFTEYTHLVF